MVADICHSFYRIPELVIPCMRKIDGMVDRKLVTGATEKGHGLKGECFGPVPVGSTNLASVFRHC